MKAQFFNKPLNYSLNIDGESWEQGSTVTGDLSISDTAGVQTDFTSLGCHLCYAQSKKLKAKDSSGIKILESIQLQAGQDHLPFNFKLDSNCPITDNAGSLQILFGNIVEPFQCGILELKVRPINTISNFIEVFELFYRFKFKALKNKKDFIETQVTPPATKEWAKIQKMLLQIKMEEEKLIVICLITIKTLSFDSSTTKTKDEVKEIRLEITKKEHTLHGATNQEGIKKHIESVLEQIRLKPIL